MYASPNKLSAKSYSRIIGANERISFAFQGLGRRLPGLLRSSVKLKNVDILYFCDVMQNQMVKANKQFNKLTGLTAKSEVDIHKILEDKNVDAIIIDTLTIVFLEQVQMLLKYLKTCSNKEFS